MTENVTDWRVCALTWESAPQLRSGVARADSFKGSRNLDFIVTSPDRSVLGFYKAIY